MAIIFDIESGQPLEVSQETADRIKEMWNILNRDIANKIEGKAIVMGTGGEIEDSGSFSKLYKMGLEHVVYGVPPFSPLAEKPEYHLNLNQLKENE